MTLLVFILAWLLINTWVTLLICFAGGNMLSEWNELGIIGLCALISPIVVLITKAIIYRVQRYKVIKIRDRKNK